MLNLYLMELFAFINKYYGTSTFQWYLNSDCWNLTSHPFHVLNLPFLAKSRGFQYYGAQQHAPGVIQTLHIFLFYVVHRKVPSAFCLCTIRSVCLHLFYCQKNGLISAPDVRHLGIFLSNGRNSLCLAQTSATTSNLNFALMLANQSPITWCAIRLSLPAGIFLPHFGAMKARNPSRSLRHILNESTTLYRGQIPRRNICMQCRQELRARYGGLATGLPLNRASRTLSQAQMVQPTTFYSGPRRGFATVKNGITAWKVVAD